MAGQAKWLRRLIRRRMMPIPEDEAYKWKSRFSWAYVLVAWNALGIVAYGVYTGKFDWADYYGLKTEEEKNMKNNEFFARNIGRPGASTKLITFRGLSHVETKEFDYETEVVNKQPIIPDDKLTLAQRIEKRQLELDRLEAKTRHASD